MDKKKLSKTQQAAAEKVAAAANKAEGKEPETAKAKAKREEEEAKAAKKFEERQLKESYDAVNPMGHVMSINHKKESRFAWFTRIFRG